MSKLTFNLNDFPCITTKAAFDKFLRACELATSVCFDTETSGLDAETCDLAGVSLAYEDKGVVHACYIPVGHQKHLGPQLKLKDVLPRIKKLLESGKPIIGANLPFDMRVLSQPRYSIKIAKWHDTQRMSYALTGNKHYQHGMDALADRIMGYKTIKFDDIVNPDWGVPDFTYVRHDTATKYSGEDTAVTLIIAKVLFKELKKTGLMRVYKQIDNPLLPVLVHMKQSGVKVNTKKLDALREKWVPEMARIEAKAKKQAGQDFNLRSPAQVARILYAPKSEGGVFELECVSFTDKGGQSVDKEALENFPGVPFVETLLEYGEYKTLVSTFVNGLPEKINPRTGRVHTDLNDTVTKTRRFSSSGPNLQNIPTRTKQGKMLRETFEAEKGCVLISADYSQIEYRVLAQVTRDSYLVQVFNDGVDMHAKMAADVRGGHWTDYNNKDDVVRYAVRSAFKNVNFAVIYGAGPARVAYMSKISVPEALDLLATHEEMCEGVYVWKEETLEFAREHGYVDNLFGGRTHLKFINNPKRGLRGGAERLAINAPIQGGAADLIRLAMPRVLDTCVAGKSKLCLQVHDELIVEAPKASAKQMCGRVARAMETAADELIDWIVPIKAEANFGSTWLEAK